MFRFFAVRFRGVQFGGCVELGCKFRHPEATKRMFREVSLWEFISLIAFKSQGSGIRIVG